MSTTLQKLQPNGDLQCFFYHPSAIAALSGTSQTGFTLSGTWRQQFDWAVVEWDRDNVYEHPALRNLPDGDLSRLTLTYNDTRTNCITIDSDLFHTVSWPFLRVWAPDTSGVEQVYQVPLLPLATPISGSYAEAYADFTLSGTLTIGDFVGLAYLGEHVTYQIGGWEGTIANVLTQIVAAFASSSDLRATSTGATIRVYYTGGAAIGSSTTGANGNRFSLYSYTCSATGAASTLSWDSPGKAFANGTSPSNGKSRFRSVRCRDTSIRITRLCMRLRILIKYGGCVGHTPLTCRRARTHEASFKCKSRTGRLRARTGSIRWRGPGAEGSRITLRT